MAFPFLGEIKIFAIDYAPRSWAKCDGLILPINQNQALFSLLGTTYGGNGQTTFALPDLRAKVPLHAGDGLVLGSTGGETAHTLTQAELPTHTHVVTASAAVGNNVIPTNNLLASPLNATYRAPDQGLGTLLPGSLTNVGGSQAHENRQPFLPLTFCIALQGIFP